MVAADEELRDGIVAALRECGDTMPECLMPLLRRAAEASTSAERGVAGLDAIARDCADRLRAVCERPPRTADDWAVAWAGCGCRGHRAIFGSPHNPLDHAVAVPFLPWPSRDRDVGPECQQVELDCVNSPSRQGRLL